MCVRTTFVSHGDKWGGVQSERRWKRGSRGGEGEGHAAGRATSADVQEGSDQGTKQKQIEFTHKGFRKEKAGGSA